MKLTKLTILVLLILSAAMASGSVLARGRAHFGFYFGGPLYWPGPYYSSPYYNSYPPYYSPYSYYYPPVVAAPPVYVEQGGSQAVPPAPQNNWWYYCADARAYYPYVRECPAGWQRVAPQPPS